MTERQSLVLQFAAGIVSIYRSNDDAPPQFILTITPNSGEPSSIVVTQSDVVDIIFSLVVFLSDAGTDFILSDIQIQMLQALLARQ